MGNTCPRKQSGERLRVRSHNAIIVLRTHKKKLKKSLKKFSTNRCKIGFYLFWCGINVPRPSWGTAAWEADHIIRPHIQQMKTCVQSRCSARFYGVLLSEPPNDSLTDKFGSGKNISFILTIEIIR